MFVQSPTNSTTSHYNNSSPSYNDFNDVCKIKVDAAEDFNLNKYFNNNNFINNNNDNIINNNYIKDDKSLNSEDDPFNGCEKNKILYSSVNSLLNPHNQNVIYSTDCNSENKLRTCELIDSSFNNDDDITNNPFVLDFDCVTGCNNLSSSEFSDVFMDFDMSCYFNNYNKEF